MNVPFVLADLVCNISEEHPAGWDIRTNNASRNLYYKVKDARNSARTKERKSQLEYENISACDEWKVVLDCSVEIIKYHSKDMEIVAWLTEALLRGYGIAGLTFGYQLIFEIINTYWGEIYPMPDDDGIEATFSSLAGLNGINSEGSLIIPIREVKITNSSCEQQFSFYQYQQALVESKEKGAGAVDGSILGEIQKASIRSGHQFYDNLKLEIQLCSDIFCNVNALLVKQCGEKSPPYSYIKSVLNELLDHVGYLSEGIENNNVCQVHSLPADKFTEQEKTPKKATEIGIYNKEIALTQIREIAHFFKRTEPHSPIPYLLERALHWADMPLPDFLLELITDESSLMAAFKLAGINKVSDK